MKKILLVIPDGWGLGEQEKGNAIHQASTPNMDRFYREHSAARLEAAGEAVGLPAGQMGNSEVGHLNLGAGRIVCQELTRISKAIESGGFFENPVLQEAMQRTRNGTGALHLVGLVSDGGVHSHLDHLLALLELADRERVPAVYVHAILDGRDTLPYGAKPYLEKLSRLCRELGRGRVATVSGRYYAMDRDQRWDRIERAYRAFTRGGGLKANGSLEALEAAYGRGEGDEFVQPTVIVDQGGQPLATIRSEDSVIFFNFRPDRARQLSRAFTEKDFKPFDRGSNPPLPRFITMTKYDREMDAPAAFVLDDLEETLGEVYAKAGLPQIRIAETEKYAHVTFFFSGGREKPFPGEDRILVPSPRIPTYDLQPEMSAASVTEQIVNTIVADKHCLIVANYANADMVGHTGKLKAAIKAVEAVDRGLGEIAAVALPRGWLVLVCSDHGNAEEMENDGDVLTAHSSNPVPFVLLGPQRYKLRTSGILADVAPTILELASLPKPPQMTGSSMLNRNKSEEVSR